MAAIGSLGMYNYGARMREKKREFERERVESERNFLTQTSKREAGDRLAEIERRQVGETERSMMSEEGLTKRQEAERRDETTATGMTPYQAATLGLKAEEFGFKQSQAELDYITKGLEARFASMAGFQQHPTQDQITMQTGLLRNEWIKANYSPEEVESLIAKTPSELRQNKKTGEMRWYNEYGKPVKSDERRPFAGTQREMADRSTVMPAAQQRSVSKAPYLPESEDEGPLGEIMESSPSGVQAAYERTPAEQRPIELIRGTERTYWSPGTQQEYGDMRTAMAGFQQHPTQDQTTMQTGNPVKEDTAAKAKPGVSNVPTVNTRAALDTEPQPVDAGELYAKSKAADSRYAIQKNVSKAVDTGKKVYENWLLRKNPQLDYTFGRSAMGR